MVEQLRADLDRRTQVPKKVNQPRNQYFRSHKIDDPTLGRVTEWRTHLLLESLALLERQAVRLRDDGDDVDDLAELLHNDHVDRAERMSRRVDEVQAAVDARVLDVPVAHRGELLA